MASELLREAKSRVASRVLTSPGVNAVGVGRRVVNGEPQDEFAVRVLVTRKRPPDQISSSQTLPRDVSVRGRRVKVDVERGGPFFPLAVMSLASEIAVLRRAGVLDVYTGRYRPVPFGVSIGHVDITAGTCGCLVTDIATQSTQILSNNHVLANSNKGLVGDKILQPGPADGGKASTDTVATLRRFVPISFTGLNQVDAAIATPAASTVTASAVNNVIPAIGTNHRAVGLLFAGDCSGSILACVAGNVANQLGIAFPGGHGTPQPDMRVEKVGRTTGWTVSQIKETEIEASVSYGAGRLARYNQLLRIPAMGQGGDSGSVIIDGGTV